MLNIHNTAKRKAITKRLFDYLCILSSVIIIVPIIVLITILVRGKLGAPILFTQVRPGQHGKPFRIYKFRTMTDQKDTDGNLLSDADRLIPFGRFLRSTSLDELPELINVLKGEMSLVGPRPLLLEYLSRYTPEQARRHEILPGITGWAQVNGRNAISWEDKFKLDVWYVDNSSFWLDIKILFMTIWKTVKREDISQEGQATVKYFMGSNRQSKIHYKQGRLQ